MDSNQLYNYLCEKRSVTIKCADTKTFGKLKNALYKKQSLLNSIAGKTDKLCTSYDAEAGTATFILQECPPPTSFEILE